MKESISEICNLSPLANEFQLNAVQWSTDNQSDDNDYIISQHTAFHDNIEILSIKTDNKRNCRKYDNTINSDNSSDEDSSSSDTNSSTTDEDCDSSTSDDDDSDKDASTSTVRGSVNELYSELVHINYEGLRLDKRMILNSSKF